MKSKYSSDRAKKKHEANITAFSMIFNRLVINFVNIFYDVVHHYECTQVSPIEKKTRILSCDKMAIFFHHVFIKMVFYQHLVVSDMPFKSKITVR